MTIATARYGCHFDPETGLIDFGQSQGHLRHQWANVEETAQRNRYAAFFLKANPGIFVVWSSPAWRNSTSPI